MKNTRQIVRNILQVLADLPSVEFAEFNDKMMEWLQNEHFLFQTKYIAKVHDEVSIDYAKLVSDCVIAAENEVIMESHPLSKTRLFMLGLLKMQDDKPTDIDWQKFIDSIT